MIRKFSIFSVLSLCFAFLVSPIVALAETVIDYGRQALTNFQPNASMSIAVDTFARPVAMLNRQASQFRSFVTRALDHRRYFGGEFQPGAI